MRAAAGTADVLGDALKPLEGDGHVGAPLGGGQRMDLVDDHRLHPDQRLPDPGREHQVQRLGGGDQQIGRVPGQQPAILGRGVPGPQRNPRLVERFPQAFSGEPDALERCPEVLLHVDGQGTQR